MASLFETEGAATSSRCTRADCTALHEELELLRGDLLELEGENEQLYEQLATVQSDASAQELQTQKKLVGKNSKIIELNEKVVGLVTQLQQQVKLYSEKETALTSLDKPVFRPVEDNSLVFQVQNEALDLQSKGIQVQLEREATAGIKAGRQGTQVAKKIEDERTELYSSLKKNELLRHEIAELQEAMKTMTTQVKEYQVPFTAMQDQLEAYRNAVDDQTLEISQLQTKVEGLEEEKMSLEVQLIEMNEKESNVDAMMSDVKAKVERAVLLAESNELKQQQEPTIPVNDEEEDKLTGILGSANTDLNDWERQLKMLQELRTRDKSTILRLNQRILQQQIDMESIVKHLNVDTVVESTIETAAQTKRELENVQSKRQTLEISQSVSGPGDARNELLRALEAAKVRSQRQEDVIYHLRAKVASLHNMDEIKGCEKNKSPPYDYQNQTRESFLGKHAGEACAQFYKGEQTSTCADESRSKAPLLIQCGKSEGDRDDELPPLLIGKEHACSKNDFPLEDNEHTDAAINYPPTKQIPSSINYNSKSGDELSDRADNIALVVAKAIEAQFALLQAQTGTLLPPKPSATGKKDDKSATRVSKMDDVKPSTDVPSQLSVAQETVNDVAFNTEDEIMQQVDVLRELNVCLDELVTTEARNEELQDQVHQHKEVFQSLMDQHTVLYQHFFQMHAQYANAEISLRHNLDQMAEEKKYFQIKCQRYEAGLHSLGVRHQQSATLSSDALICGNEAHLRSEVIELTRKIATFEVNEAQFKRTYHQLHTEWRSSKEHNKLLQHEWSDMERTLKYRILYLETWKQGADNMIERMEKTLEKSVLREFADKQQRTMARVLKKYKTLSTRYATMHAQYLEEYNLPAQLSRTQHSLKMLQAECSARIVGTEDICRSGILHDRITQLEKELQEQIKKGKELEDARWEKLTCDELVATPGKEVKCAEDNELRNENLLLYERVDEVEQLYESLALECAKYKDIASLAASQANTLSLRAAQDQGNREQQEEQWRDMMASSIDHAIVGELQHQLMQIKTTYQQFLLQYDHATESKQQTLLKNQQLELEVEKKVQELSTIREKSRDKVHSLETAIEQVKERDWIVRNTKWDAFRKRLDGLESELQTEQVRRKQLEHDLEDKQAQLPLPDLRHQCGNQSEINRLKSQVDALKSRENLFLAKLDAATKATGSKIKDSRLQVELEETKTLNEDLVRQLEAVQARVSQLLKINADLDAEERAIRCKYEDLELERRFARSGIACGESGQHDIQQDVDHGSSMRRKVGLYEKDQAELQHAAQATIASLKQLVEEKNTLINEYRRKLAVVRASSAQDKAQDRLETTQLNRKLYDENKRMIGQLKEAMGTISTMERSCKSKQALQAAQERHDQVLKEWKQAEIALDDANQLIKELQTERDVLQSERNLAEAHAGEALEEIVVLKENVIECEKHNQKLEHHVTLAKRDMAKKEDKLKALRDAIIKLKEEFFKAEDRHAIEVVKAQHAIHIDSSAKKRKEKERREKQVTEWKEEITRLQSQVVMLQEKLAVRKTIQGQQGRQKKQMKCEEMEEKDDKIEADGQTFKLEVERLEQLVKVKAVAEAKTVEGLESRIKMLQAQNLALREASTHGPEKSHVNKRQEQLEGERQRRVEVLMQRLKEKQADVVSKTSELERCFKRISMLEAELKVQKAHSESERLAYAASARPVVVSSVNAQLEEIERQNAFLRDTLRLKRREWEKLFATQMEKYELQLQRLRGRLVQRGSFSTDRVTDDSMDYTPERGITSQLRQEEQRFLVEQDVREELLALGDELRSKEHDLVTKDTRLLELELEVETLHLNYKRLHRKNEQGSDGPLKQRRGVTGRGSSWVTQERHELEKVIETMKKVIEKLRAENEKLKTASAKQAVVSPERVELMRRKLREQKDARERLEAQLEKMQSDSRELRQDKLKLQQKLRAKAALCSSFKSETSALELQLKDKDRQLLASAQDLTELQHQVHQLERQGERHNNLDDDAQIRQEEKERIKELEAHLLDLEDENTNLTNELAAFDEDFFEEIEDLKYKYAQAVRDKHQLEQNLARRVGESPPASITLRHSRS